ncbi:MAG: ParA family protein [Eubacterium sp.]|nr:ParA family protein [Eubacterium sp.]
MGKTVCIFNQKGGVGKTTTCVNMAAVLGNKGYKTLIVDIDPQGNSTSGVGVDKAEINESSYDILINGSQAKGVIIKTEFDNLYLLPANMNLAGAELELAEKSNRYAALKMALAPIVAEYDYILVDCPPSLGLLSINGLTASDTLLIPLQCEYYALEGMSQLLSTIRTVKQYYNEHLEIEGVVYTMFDSRLNLSKQIVDEINKYFTTKAYKTFIPRTVKLAEAPSFGMPIIYFDKYSKGSFAYKKLANEFLSRQ